MPPKVPPTPPFSHRFIVGTLALMAGAYVLLDAGRDFEYIKFTPHSPDEIERRKREHLGLQIKQLDTRTLEYTPEAKARLDGLMNEKQIKEDKTDREK